MTKFHASIIAITLTTISVGSLPAQTDFFWSFELGNVVNDHAERTFEVGDSGSVFLFYTTNGPIDSDISFGAFLDIATSEHGVIEFTTATTYDFHIEIGGTPVGTRWQGPGAYGETGEISSDGQFIDELHAFAIFETWGMLDLTGAGGPFFDGGYYFSADAFLFGRIDFNVIGSGSADFQLSIGDGLIANGGSEIFPTFGSATIDVESIPEPTTPVITLTVIGLASLGRRRRQ